LKIKFLYLSPTLSFQEREKNRMRNFFIDSCLRRNDKFPPLLEGEGVRGRGSAKQLFYNNYHKL
jgi:hypothetical protein